LIEKLANEPDFIWVYIADNIPARNNLNLPPNVAKDNNGDVVEYVSGSYYATILNMLYNAQAYDRS